MRSPDFAVPAIVIGGTGGDAHFFQDYNHGGFLTELSVGVGPAELNMFTVMFTSGAKHSCGSRNRGRAAPTVSEKSFKFEPGEKLVQLMVWDNNLTNRACRVTGIQILTDRGRSFDQGIAVERRGVLTTLTGSDVGSGLVTGVRARAGSDIDAIGFEFLRVVAAATLQVGASVAIVRATAVNRLPSCELPSC